MSPHQMGRPKSDNPKIERIFIRVTPEEKREIQDFSKKHGIGLLDLIKTGIEALKKNEMEGKLLLRKTGKREDEDPASRTISVTEDTIYYIIEDFPEKERRT